MTLNESNRKYRVFLFLSSVCLMCVCLYSPRHMIEYGIKGLDLCGRSIIPSLFPFMIFSDMLQSSRVFDNVPNVFGAVFERIFKIHHCAIGAFLIGALCGFPLGIKYAMELYKNGTISRDECERLICFVNNTGPSFVVAGIGVGIRENAVEGVVLYVIQIVSAILCGAIVSQKATYNLAEAPVAKKDTDFSLSESVKRSALNMVYICGFITLFSIISGMVVVVFKNEIIGAIISLFLEVGNAATICSRLRDSALSFALCAAAIAFSGMSVHMQSRVFIDGSGISTKRYYFCKLLQGIIAFLIAYLWSIFIY